MKKLFIALLLFIPSLTFAAWNAADIALCKAETKREFDSDSVWYLNGVKQPVRPFAQAAYNAAIARCNASTYVLFDVVVRYFNSYSQLTGIKHYHTPIRPEFNEVGPQVISFTFNRGFNTGVINECKPSNGLYYPSTSANCNGLPMQFSWSTPLGADTATGIEYAFKLGYSLPSTAINVHPVYRCRSTIGVWFMPPQPPTFTTNYASFSATCNNGLHSTANAGVTNLGLLGYAYAAPSANYQ